MFGWLKASFKVPQPAGPAQTIAEFGPADATITQGVIVTEGDGWRVECSAPQTVRLFEVSEPDVEQCMLTYRAELKTEGLERKAYLEMWCGLPGRGEFFSKGLHNALKGDNDWASYEIPFYLKRGQRPDLLKLNLVLEGRGSVWIRRVQLLQTPLQ